MDAFIRTTLDDRESFHGVTELNGPPIVALGVGEVIESTSDSLKPGDWVTGPLMAQEVAQLPAMMLTKIAPEANIPASMFLGILGLTTGITAWAGMVRVGEVTAADTVVVSGAAGAVGTVAGQVAKARGARVIGIAGGEAKCNFLTETLGLDAAIDYKAGGVRQALKEAAPDGVNLFFDNVGGEILDDVLDNLAEEARVVICGAISQYEDMESVRGPSLYLRLAERNCVMKGFTVMHHQAHAAQAAAELTELYVDGQLQLPEHVVQGVENFPEALIALLNGGHTGKMLVKP